MTAAPFLSIVVPAYNDSAHLREALGSALAQSDCDLEVIVVDDASTDGTETIVNSMAAADARVQVIRHDLNRTAFQARRTGVLAARGEYVAFLDGDDSLAPHMVATLRRLARTGADMVHFGAVIVGRDGRSHPRFEERLRPTAARLDGPAILSALFLDRETFEGHLWNKAYRTAWARTLFEALPPDAFVPRANDLPVSLMLAARASTYVSTRRALYRYRFGSGGTTDGSLSTERFAQLVNFRPSFDLLASEIASWQLDKSVAADVLARTREWLVQRSLSLLSQVSGPTGSEIDILLNQWPAAVLLPSLHSRFEGREQALLAYLGRHPSLAARRSEPVRTIALYLDQVGIGGMQRVASLQAQMLQKAGYRVVLLGREDLESFPYALPDDIVYVQLPSAAASTGAATSALIDGLTTAIDANEVDVVLLHANYRPELIFLVLALQRVDVRSILVIHSFALRALLDRSPLFGLLRAAAMRVSGIAVLSRTDEAFWRWAGVEHVYYVPNPVDFSHRTLPSRVDSELTCDVLWYGRINERIKRVSEVIRTFALIVERRPDARLHIVGPVSPDAQGTIRALHALVDSLGIGSSVRFLPAVSDVDALIASAKVVMVTSVVEGFAHALVEPLVVGRPVVMYDLPYLELAKDNPGIISVPWGDRGRAAAVITNLLEDEVSRDGTAQAGLAVVRERFDPDVTLGYLRTALDPDVVVDTTPSLEHATIVVKQLFELYEASLSVASASGPSVEAFYNTWHGSLTIRLSERFGGPVAGVWKVLRRIGRTLRAKM